MTPVKFNPDYIHHQSNGSSALFREMVFGMEDGMVSTLGAITGIAFGTHSLYTVVLSGLVIVSVESISMAVGSYLSSKSARGIDERKLFEETTELAEFPEEEKEELVDMYVLDGWPKELAIQMAEEASKDKKLFLKEMSYRELGIVQDKMENPLKNGLVMGLSYVLGGSIPIIAYLFLPMPMATAVSIISTLSCLFLLGVFTTKYSRRVWWKAGLEMFMLASLAASIGYIVGQVVETYMK